MKRPIDFWLIDEFVLVSCPDEKGNLQQLGKVLTVTPETNTVLIELLDRTQREYQKEELLHLYPKRIIMQGLVSNFEMSPETFKKILSITRLITQKRFVEALQLAVSDELVKFFCTTDCKSWLELQVEAHRKKKTRQQLKKNK